MLKGEEESAEEQTQAREKGKQTAGSLEIGKVGMSQIGSFQQSPSHK